MLQRLTSRLPWLMVAAALALTIAATGFVWRLRHAVTEARFANAVQSTTDRITGRIEVYSVVLRSGAALWAASTDVSEADFHRFVERLDLQQRFPGIQGIGWSQRLLYQPDSIPDARHAIRYLEPMDDRNRAAIGFDMYSDSTRRVAMRRARDEAQPALSGRVTLVQEIRGPRQAGFLLYVPVYATRDLPPTVAERRRDLTGFVYAAFRADDLFAGIFGTETQPRVSFVVFDGTAIDSTRVLHRSPGDVRVGSLLRVVPLMVAGQPWTVEFRSAPAIEAGLGFNLVWVTLLGGLVVTVIIGWMAVVQARTREVAEQANQAKSNFLAVMSHELRTPLNAIGGYSELIALGIHGPVTDAQRDALSRMQRAKDHLLSLINSVLDYARLEAGRVELATTRVRVAELMAGVADLIAPQAQARGVALVHDVDGLEVDVAADPEKAQQALLNLVSNAVKFTPGGGRVTLRAREVDYAVVIEVRDTGVGIAPEKLASIFDPFVQADAGLTRGSSGSGLGLAIARDLARAMGGDITAESSPGEGSVFVLRLPIAGRDR